MRLLLDNETTESSLWSRLGRLEADTAETFEANSTGLSRWMIPYADLLTLLLAFFVALYAMTMAPEKLQAQTQSNQQQARQQEPALALSAVAPMSLSEDPVDHRLKDLEKTTQGIRVLHRSEGLVISLSDQILFAPGQATLTPEAQAVLDPLAKKLKVLIQNASADSPALRIEGHTDDTPISTLQFPSNWELSTARATEILKYLVLQHHFKPGQLSATGYGEFKPLVENSSREGKQKNRRVDIVLLQNHLN